jgi:tetratricopeptide (TPR) repeat protein
MTDHVFICYSRKDENFVKKLAENLKHLGIPVWLDQWDIPPGANYPRAIEGALIDCAHLLIVLSPASVDSDPVQSEWFAALEEKKAIIPILYQTCRIPLRLKPIQYIDFTSRSPDDSAALNEVLAALGKAKSALSGPDESSVPKEKLSEPSSSAFNQEKEETWHRKGLALSKSRMYREAIQAFQSGIQLNPNNAELWSSIGNALRHLEEYDDAIKAYGKAITLNPSNEFYRAKSQRCHILKRQKPMQKLAKEEQKTKNKDINNLKIADQEFLARREELKQRVQAKKEHKI